MISNYSVRVAGVAVLITLTCNEAIANGLTVIGVRQEATGTGQQVSDGPADPNPGTPPDRVTPVELRSRTDAAKANVERQRRAEKTKREEEDWARAKSILDNLDKNLRSVADERGSYYYVWYTRVSHDGVSPAPALDRLDLASRRVWDELTTRGWTPRLILTEPPTPDGPGVWTISVEW